jgi:hypothetical protein
MFSKRIKKKIEDALLNTHTSKFHIFSATTIGSDSSKALFQVYSTEETTKKPETMLAHHHTVALKNSLREPIRLHINGESLI